MIRARRRCSPPDLRGLPPAIVITAGFDSSATRARRTRGGSRGRECRSGLRRRPRPDPRLRPTRRAVSRPARAASARGRAAAAPRHWPAAPAIRGMSRHDGERRSPAHRHHRLRLLGALPRRSSSSRRASSRSRSSRRPTALGGTWRDNTLSGRRLRRPVVRLLLLVRAEDRLVAEVVAAARDPRLHGALRAEVRHPRRTSASAPRSPRRRFDEAAGVWRLRTTAGEELDAEVLVSGIGQLNRPSFPTSRARALPGRSRSTRRAGTTTCDLARQARRRHRQRRERDPVHSGDRAAGRAAAHVFQRSANWMLPRGSTAPYSEREKRRFARFPGLARALPLVDLARVRDPLPGLPAERVLSKRGEQARARASSTREVADPTLRATLAPDYPIGGKRILISDDYYPALERDERRARHEPDRAHRRATAS